MHVIYIIYIVLCLWGVVRAPIRWWDTTPLGRVLNRFSFLTDAPNCHERGMLLTLVFFRIHKLGAPGIQSGTHKAPNGDGSYLQLLHQLRLRHRQRGHHVVNQAVSCHHVTELVCWSHWGHGGNLLAVVADLHSHPCHLAGWMSNDHSGNPSSFGLLSLGYVDEPAE